MKNRLIFDVILTSDFQSVSEALFYNFDGHKWFFRGRLGEPRVVNELVFSMFLGPCVPDAVPRGSKSVPEGSGRPLELIFHRIFNYFNVFFFPIWGRFGSIG